MHEHIPSVPAYNTGIGNCDNFGFIVFWGHFAWSTPLHIRDQCRISISRSLFCFLPIAQWILRHAVLSLEGNHGKKCWKQKSYCGHDHLMPTNQPSIAGDGEKAIIGVQVALSPMSSQRKAYSVFPNVAFTNDRMRRSNSLLRYPEFTWEGLHARMIWFMKMRRSNDM